MTVLQDRSKEYNYILLDWDGNLAMTLELWLGIIRKTLLDVGIHQTDKQIAATFGHFDKSFAQLGVPNAEEVLDRAIAEGYRLLADVKLYPNVTEVLEYLMQSGKHMALTTSSKHDAISDLLAKHDLRKFFEVIVARDDVTHQKPDPEQSLLAMKQLGAVPNETIIIGDSDKDLGAANNVGIDCILFYPPEHDVFYDINELQLLNPTYTIEDFGRVKEIIR